MTGLGSDEPVRPPVSAGTDRSVHRSLLISSGLLIKTIIIKLIFGPNLVSMRSERARTPADGAWFLAPHRRLAAWSSLWSMWHLGPCSAAPSSGPMMNRPGGRSNRSVAPADSAGVACGAAAPRGPTRGSRGSRRIRRERCSEGASCCDADGYSRASVCAPQRRSRCALARRGRLAAPPARAGARGSAWSRRISRSHVT